MTIFQLISSEGYYGAESMLVSLGRAIAALGCRSVVGVIRNSRSPHTEVAEEAQRSGLEVEVIPCEGRWDRGTVARLRSVLEKLEVDIVQPHGYKADIYAFAAAWRSRVALFSTLHNWTSKRLSMRMYFAIDLLVLRWFDGIATPSERVAATLRKTGLPGGKIVTIPNGVDVASFRSAQPVLRREIPEQHLVGFVGRLVAGKGGPALLHAARIVVSKRPDTTFVLVGDGPERKEWEALAKHLGIAKKVVFTGVRRDMPGVYASLDMVVLPSLVEAMPMCLLEALAAGRPVIATPVGSVPRVVLPEKTGLLVSPGDAVGMARAILRLLENPPLAKQLGEEGRAHVVREFSAEAGAKAYFREYEKILAKRSGAARSRVARQESEA